MFIVIFINITPLQIQTLIIVLDINHLFAHSWMASSIAI